LDRYDAANVYLIQDTTIEVSVLIKKKDGSLPDKTKVVAPVNNFLHSMFESVRLIINDIPITSSASNYPYKAYIANCLTYSTLVKTSQLACQGWYSDLGNHMGPVEENSGFTERSNLFRKNYDPRSEYKSTGTTLIGRLMHDLISCETGLPPNTKVKIELDRSENSFCLMCPNDDPENYELKIENIALFIPVAQLSASVFQEINSIMTRKINPQTIGIHYRRIEVRPFSLGVNKIEFNSDTLFTDSDLPCKIVLCFVKTKDKNGDYHTNPFDLRRSWEYTESANESNIEQSNQKSEREVMLEKRIASMEEQLRIFQETLKPKKGKGRGKKSNYSEA
jgi:hypothetical protein